MSSATTHSTSPTVGDYKHPEWCDLTLCDPHSKSTNDEAYGVHYSAGTRWGLQADEADFMIQLVRGDDLLHGFNHATTSVRVTLTNWATMADTGTDARADAEMDPKDARMLAAFLNRYADMAERSNRHRGNPYDLDPEDVPRKVNPR